MVGDANEKNETSIHQVVETQRLAGLAREETGDQTDGAVFLFYLSSLLIWHANASNKRQERQEKKRHHRSTVSRRPNHLIIMNFFLFLSLATACICSLFFELLSAAIHSIFFFFFCYLRTHAIIETPGIELLQKKKKNWNEKENRFVGEQRVCNKKMKFE